MPSYASRPFERTYGESIITLFQPKNSKSGSIYYRLALPGRPRLEGKLKATIWPDEPRTIDMTKIERHRVWNAVDAEITRLLVEESDRASKGLLPARKKITLVDVAEKWVATLEQDVEQGHATESALINRRGFIEHYVKKYTPFRTKNIADIDDTAIGDWARWRDAYWISGPGSRLENAALRKRMEGKRVSKNSRNKHVTYLTDIYEFAIGKKMFVRKNMPLLKQKERSRGYVPTASDHARPMVDDNDWKKLLETVPRWLDLAKTEHHRRERGLTWCLAITLRSYGLRVAEAYALQWWRLKLDASEITIDVPPVGGERKRHPRDVRPLPSFAAISDEVLRVDLPALHKEHFGKEPGSHDRLFKLANNEDFAKHFLRLLNLAGLLHAANGARRSLGSFRHSAITELLLAGVPTGIVVKWAGTSLVMLDQHYSKIIVARDAQSEWQRLRERAATSPVRLVA